MTDGNIVDLTDEDFLMSPVCHTCTEPTKRVIGKNFDIEGPGMVGVLYGCDNCHCRKIKDRKWSYLLALTRM